MEFARKKRCFLQMELLEARDCPSAGALDATFGTGGFAIADFHPTRGENSQTIAIQPDGKMVVAGFAYQAPIPKNSLPQDFALARFIDGTLDTSFGTGGKVVTDFGSHLEKAMAVSIVTEPGPHYGKIVVAGESGPRIAVARYNSNGSLDSSFDGDGKVLKNLPKGALSYGGTSILPLPGGKILIGGHWSSSGAKEGFALIRFNANGGMDTTFDGDGFAMPTLTTDGHAFPGFTCVPCPIRGWPDHRGGPTTHYGLSPYCIACSLSRQWQFGYLVWWRRWTC